MKSVVLNTAKNFSQHSFYSFSNHTNDPKNYNEFVRIIITDYQNRYLVMKTKYNDKFFWIFPGGQVEAGESKDDTLKRELMEELNLTIPSYKYLGTFFTRPYKGKDWRGYFYLAKNIPAENLRLIRNNEPEKCSAIKFFELNDLYSAVIEEDSYVTKQILEEFFMDKI